MKASFMVLAALCAGVPAANAQAQATGTLIVTVRSKDGPSRRPRSAPEA